MPAAEIIPVVLNLVRIHNSSLRSVGRRTEGEKGRVTKQDSGKTVGDAALIRNRVADGVSPKFNIYAAVGCSKLTSHPACERPHPTERIVLRESRDVIRISGSGPACYEA